MDHHLYKKLLKTRRDIRKKYRSLKSEIKQAQSQLEKTYQPITKPLKQLLSSLEKTDNVKKEQLNPKIEEDLPSIELKPFTFKKSHVSKRQVEMNGRQSLEPTFQGVETSSILGDETMTTEPMLLQDTETYETTLPEVEVIDQYIDETFPQNLVDILNETTTETLNNYLSQYASIPRTYIEESMMDTTDVFDHILGVTHDYLTESYKIGDSRINFVNSPDPNEPRNTLAGPDFIIKDIYYIGTPGLYELLFKKHPIGFKETDVNNYVDIVRRTNALFIDNDPTKRKRTLPRDIRDKHMFIILPKLETRPRSSLPVSSKSTVTTRRQAKMGGALSSMDLTNKTVEYRYFDNFNEIVDRLRLLVSSTISGNNNLGNEIKSIIEELREGRVIK